MNDQLAAYVITASGNIYLQITADNQYGFSICSEDQTWPGGFGLGEWTLIDNDDPRITDADRERIQWIIDEVSQ